MDAKDVRIFCEMAFKSPKFNAFRDRHISPSGIGRNIGLDEKTVRVRVRRMEDEGSSSTTKLFPASPSSDSGP